MSVRTIPVRRSCAPWHEIGVGSVIREQMLGTVVVEGISWFGGRSIETVYVHPGFRKMDLLGRAIDCSRG